MMWVPILPEENDDPSDDFEVVDEFLVDNFPAQLRHIYGYG